MANNAKHPQIPLLLTRPLGVAQAFYDALPSQIQILTRPILSPLIEIVPLDTPVPDTEIVIFTSGAALDYSGAARGRPAYCVGEITTRKAREQGWDAVLMGQTADELVTKVIALKPTTPLLHLAGRHTRGDVAMKLTAASVPTRHLALYDQKRRDLMEGAVRILSGEAPVIVPLFSPRTAQQFARQALGIAPLKIIALSDAVAQELSGKIEAEVTNCPQPTRKAMAQEIKKAVLSLTLG